MRGFLATVLLLSACGGDDDVPPPPPNLGNLIITWDVIDTEGNPKTCSEAGANNALVRVGPTSVEVPCGEDQRVTFERLQAGTYGVTIQLVVSGLGALVTVTDNVEVLANQDTEANVTVIVNASDPNRSELLFQWIVIDEDPQITCAQVGAAEVLFQTTDSSIGEFEVRGTCESGQLLITDLDPGGYEVLATLRDARDERVGVAQIVTPRLPPGQRAIQDLNFIVPSTAAPALFEGSWTITGSVASDACMDVNGDRVEVVIRTRPPMGGGVTIGTASAACDAGQVTIGDLPSGTGEVRATFTLFSDFLGTALDGVVTPSFFLREGETSTASVDFQIID